MAIKDESAFAPNHNDSAEAEVDSAFAASKAEAAFAARKADSAFVASKAEAAASWADLAKFAICKRTKVHCPLSVSLAEFGVFNGTYYGTLFNWLS